MLSTLEGLPKHHQCFSPLPECHIPLPQFFLPITNIPCHLQFTLKNRLKFLYLLKVILLRMFDSSTMLTINRTCCIPITFSTGELHTMELFVTKLDKEYLVVLGYDWLTQHNTTQA